MSENTKEQVETTEVVAIQTCEKCGSVLKAGQTTCATCGWAPSNLPQNDVQTAVIVQSKMSKSKIGIIAGAAIALLVVVLVSVFSSPKYVLQGTWEASYKVDGVMTGKIVIDGDSASFGAAEWDNAFGGTWEVKKDGEYRELDLHIDGYTVCFHLKRENGKTVIVPLDNEGKEYSNRRYYKVD